MSHTYKAKASPKTPAELAGERALSLATSTSLVIEKAQEALAKEIFAVTAPRPIGTSPVAIDPNAILACFDTPDAVLVVNTLVLGNLACALAAGSAVPAPTKLQAVTTAHIQSLMKLLNGKKIVFKDANGAVVDPTAAIAALVAQLSSVASVSAQ